MSALYRSMIRYASPCVAGSTRRNSTSLPSIARPLPSAFAATPNVKLNLFEVTELLVSGRVTFASTSTCTVALPSKSMASLVYSTQESNRSRSPTDTGAWKLTSSSSMNTGRRPVKRYAVAKASSYARRIKKPPKTRPAVLRCCGIVISAFCSRVALKRMSLLSASAGMVRRSCAASTSSAAALVVSASMERPSALSFDRFRAALRASSRLRPISNACAAAASPSGRMSGLMAALRLVSGFLATKVNVAQRNGSSVHVAHALIEISIDDLPTHETAPASFTSSCRLGRWR
mmetsp:Transcript_8396/g.20115  ORF Transcript_8396/g.20115 Transcript_8396/m.20115 type:complete len:290 (-) Transcript_8396:250-1119(-)